MKKNCDHYLELIPEYIDGNLPADKKSDFEQHIAACSYCRNELEKQYKWLAGSFVSQDEPELTNEDKNRLHNEIMETIRSNEQSHRAASYISAYKNKNESSDAGIKNYRTEDDLTNSKEETVNRKKEKKFWRSLPVITGYAAVIVLLFITAILIRDLNRNDESLSLSDRVDVDSINDEELNQTEAGGDYQIDVLNDDSATLPMLETESIEESSNASIMDESEESSDGNAEQPGTGRWSVYNGRLEDLPLDTGVFSESTGSAGVFNSSEALRILIHEIEQNGSTTESNNEAGELDDPENTGAEEQDQTTTNKPVVIVNRVFMLTAWNSWDVHEAADSLMNQLEQENSANYDIIILDNNETISKIEEMIGPDETLAWQNQIDEQNLEDLIWLAYISN